MDTDNFIAYIKTEDVHTDIAECVKQDLTLQTMN